jgi:hypothetical protein
MSMQVFLIIFLFFAFLLLANVAAMVISLILGIVLLFFPRFRFLAPVFLLIVPSAVICGLAGGIGIGYLVFKYNINFVLLGPIAGLLIGGVVGLLTGTVLSCIWWFIGKKNKHKTPANT